MIEGDEYLDKFLEVEEGIEPLLSEGAIDDALKFTKRAKREYSSNRQPRVLVAGAVYLAGSLHGDNVNQAEVMDVLNVTQPSIRDAYREIAKQEGIYPTEEVDCD